MDKTHVAFIVIGTIGCVLVILGYLIKYKGRIRLVAGVRNNEDKIKDKKGFASFVGGNVLILGLIFCAGALGIYIFPSWFEIIEPAILLSLLITGIITFKKIKKY
ncbi:MAG: hypothetical protein JW746_06280 [Candidatus Krumholzibacteriota bacterium]|nr:hypothetical protein [Candidatus Krumholzibacteriota bacterium]